jgi:cysteinyl-tRNA synthetase
MLGVHYRQPIDWTHERLTSAKIIVHGVASWTRSSDFRDKNSFAKAWREDAAPSTTTIEALRDDLNTPETLANIENAVSRISRLADDERIQLVHDMRFLGLFRDEVQGGWLTGAFSVKQMPENLINVATFNFRNYRIAQANRDVEIIKQIGGIFESQNIRVKSNNTIVYTGQDPSRGIIERLVAERSAAREAKNWAESDRLRDRLAALGVAIKDNKNGKTSWELKR